MKLQEAFITLGGAGYLTKAPGTLGSLIALPLGVAIVYYLGLGTLFLSTLLLTIISIIEIDKYEHKSQTHDAKHIIIDELVGMWIALVFALGSKDITAIAYGEFIAIGAAFVAFRLFDIYKPSTIGWIDRNLKGGKGVVLDDLLAGVAAGAVVTLGFRAATMLF